MKVLMLGWELPPRISGGLGPACAGLARGLVDQGVEVVFVVPHLGGEERLEGARLVSADRVPLEAAGPAPAAPSSPAAPQDAATPREPLAEASPPVATLAEPLAWAADLPEAVRVLAVESALRPYLGEQEYVRLLERVQAPRPAGARIPTAAPAGAPAPAATGEAVVATATASTDASPAPVRPSYLALQGGYGPDLFSEVARFAQVAAVLARRERFDVVHAHDWMTFPAGAAAARAADRPLVAHVHASEFDRSGEQADTRIREIEAAGLAAAQRVVCVSRYTAEVVGRRYGVPTERLRVVHNAVQPRQDRGEPEARRRHPLVLFLGRVTSQKGPEYFLEAAARVLQVAADVRFVVSGSGDLLPRVVERAAELGIARRVSFTGFLEREAVERVLGMADVYVMPSVSEPFGIAPLEAMAQDVPVIVSRQSGVAEVLRSALKVDYWDVDEMANKILALLRYPALRRTLSGEGRSELDGMTWTERGRRLREVYEEVVA